jgi:integrase
MPGGRPRKPKPKPHNRDWHQGSVRELPSGRFQGIRARDPVTKKRPTRTFTTRQQAEAWGSGSVAVDVLTLGVWLDRWLGLRWPTLRISSQDVYRRSVAACAPLAGHPLADLTTDDWQRLANTLLAKWARSHVVTWRKAIGAAMNYAVRQGHLTRNPLKDIALPRATDNPPKAWTREQIARLLVAVHGDPQEVWFLVAIGTGIRLGEARALLWDDIDFPSLTVSITKSQHITRRVVGPTKTGKHRTVDLPEELVPVLVAHHGRMQPSARLVFGNRHDRAHSGSTYGIAVTRICKRAGVTRLTPHALRHTAASLMLTANVSPSEVAAQLGHTVAVLLQTYSHLLNAGERRAAKALGELFSGRPGAVGVEIGARI